MGIMLSIVRSATLRGIEAVEISVEVDAAHGGLPGEALVGLPDTVVRESKNRIKSAIKNSGFKYPIKFYTINLAPADFPKEGPLLDVPIAVGILQSTDQIPIKEDILFVGELSLNGEIKPIRGAISICHMAAKRGYKAVVLPFDNALESLWIEDVSVIPVKSLKQIKEYLEGNWVPTIPRRQVKESLDFEEDMSDVKGQVLVKRALEIAAAGQHNVLLIGSPGSGKSMLLKRLQTILPPMTIEEAIESFKVHSISHKAGLGLDFTLSRPFRNPHHTISFAGLVGGGATPRPGEISLAHQGVLFLDELPEFNRNVIEVLRQPLEDRKVTISRAMASLSFPANCLFVSAMNPCPCGYFGDRKIRCTCLKEQVKKYWKKISGPILDRIDIVVTVERVSKEELFGHSIVQQDSYSSSAILERVMQARARQVIRSGNLNAHLSAKLVKKYCNISSDIQTLLGRAVDKGVLSARAYIKVLKVSRTIADIQGDDELTLAHVSEALQYRGGARIGE